MDFLGLFMFYKFIMDSEDEKWTILLCAYKWILKIDKDDNYR